MRKTRSFEQDHSDLIEFLVAIPGSQVARFGPALQLPDMSLLFPGVDVSPGVLVQSEGA